MRRSISSGSAFEQAIGYSRAVQHGDWVFVSGTTGFDYATMPIADSIVLQAEQCFINISGDLAVRRMRIETGATARMRK
jgi:enamine deaminase RidA (YjgF/YER057c/UK114 family)